KITNYPNPRRSPQVTPHFPFIHCNSTCVAGFIQKIRPNSRSRRPETPALDVLPHYDLAEQKLPISPAVSGSSAGVHQALVYSRTTTLLSRSCRYLLRSPVPQKATFSISTRSFAALNAA